MKQIIEVLDTNSRGVAPNLQQHIYNNVMQWEISPIGGVRCCPTWITLSDDGWVNKSMAAVNLGAHALSGSSVQVRWHT